MADMRGKKRSAANSRKRSDGLITRRRESEFRPAMNLRHLGCRTVGMLRGFDSAVARLLCLGTSWTDVAGHYGRFRRVVGVGSRESGRVSARG